MNADLKSTLTETLADHALDSDYCACGWRMSPDYGTAADWAAHVADVLLGLPGVAVTALPEPTWLKTADDDENGASAWEYPDGGIVVYDTGDYEWRAFGINDDDASRLRDGAAALLAAAVVSEGETR